MHSGGSGLLIKFLNTEKKILSKQKSGFFRKIGPPPGEGAGNVRFQKFWSGGSMESVVWRAVMKWKEFIKIGKDLDFWWNLKFYYQNLGLPKKGRANKFFGKKQIAKILDGQCSVCVPKMKIIS